MDNTIEWNVSNTYEFASPSKSKYTFKSALHTFSAVLNPVMKTIKIGGTYDDCVNITFESKDMYSAHISHIEAEPECGLDSFLQDGEGSEMLKASIQFVHELYPDIRYFSLDDMSRIDCKKPPVPLEIPPRKFVQPFSLPHLSIATSGYTWYEKHFGAYYIDADEHANYRNNVERLNERISIPLETFANKFGLTGQQQEMISNYYMYEPSPDDGTYSNDWIQDKKRRNWLNLFRSIPVAERCNILYNWLESCINILTDRAFVSSRWIIDYEKMPKTSMKIITSHDSTKTGGKRSGSRGGSRGGSRKIRRRKGRIYMTNNYYHKL